MFVDRRPEEDDALVQEARVDVEERSPREVLLR